MVARFQQGLAHKLILVSAPAGYGKTKLLGDWLAACELRPAWISLARRDHAPARFWTYVEAAIRWAMSSVGTPFPDIPYDHDLSVSEVLLTDLIDELAKRQQPIILVLDDYHKIEPRSFMMECSAYSNMPLPILIWLS